MIIKSSNSRVICGFLLAPFIPIMILILTLHAEKAIGLLLNKPKIYDPSLESIDSALILFGVPFMYVLAALIGWPTVFILKKLKYKHWIGFSLSGLFWGLILGIIYSSLINATVEIVFSICIYSIIASIVF